MDKINKFLLNFNKRERAIFLAIFEDIRNLNIKTYDVKPLKGMKGIFRLRAGKIRIIFCIQNKTGIILNIGFRKDIYKK